MRLYRDKFVHDVYKIQQTGKFNVTLKGFIDHHKILSALFCVVGGWGGCFLFFLELLNIVIVFTCIFRHAIVQKRGIIWIRQFYYIFTVENKIQYR